MVSLLGRATAADLFADPPAYYHPHSARPAKHKKMHPAYRSFNEIVREQQGLSYQPPPARAPHAAHQIGQQGSTAVGQEGTGSASRAALSSATYSWPGTLSAVANKATDIIKVIASLLLGAGLLVGALALLLRIPEVARAIDALFVPSSEAEPVPGTHEAEAELMSAADIRSQTEILRSLKEQLDAQLQAARDTIRRERAQDEQQAGKENV